MDTELLTAALATLPHPASDSSPDPTPETPSEPPPSPCTDPAISMARLMTNQSPDYWARLRMDGQVTAYYLGAEALGTPPVGCLYDVIARPMLRPADATPLESRRYTKGKPCKVEHVDCPVCQIAPQNEVVPFGLRLPVPIFVFVTLFCSERDFCDTCAVFKFSDFGVLPGVTDKNN